jgi:hypothetical protein
VSKAKKTPKESLKYWKVGPKALKIKARTARAAARKYMCGKNPLHDFVVSEHELHMPCNKYSGFSVDEVLSRENIKVSINIEDIKVEPWKENEA